MPDPIILEILQFPDYPPLKVARIQKEHIDTAVTTTALDMSMQNDDPVNIRLCNYMEHNKVSFYISTHAAGVNAIRQVCAQDYVLRPVEDVFTRTKSMEFDGSLSVYELQRKTISHQWSKKISMSKNFTRPLIHGIDWERVLRTMTSLKGPVQLQLKICNYIKDERQQQHLQELRFTAARDGMNDTYVDTINELMHTDLYMFNIHVFAGYPEDAEIVACSVSGTNFSATPIQGETNMLQDLLHGSFYIKNNCEEKTPIMLDNYNYILRRREADLLFQLPFACSTELRQLPGLQVVQTNPFTYEGRPSGYDQYPISLGTYRSGTSYSIPVFELLKHGVVFGKPGFGKTVTTMGILKQIANIKVPFLLIESAKTEYHNALKPLFKEDELRVYNFKNPFQQDFFKINPLMPMRNVSIAQHISSIKGCFMAAIPMVGATPYIFEAMLYDFYKSIICEGDESLMFEPDYIQNLSGETRKCLSITSLYKFVDIYLGSNADLFSDSANNDFAPVLKRRLDRLAQNSVIAHAFTCTDTHWEVSELFQRPTLIELDALSDDSDKALIMSMVLAYLDEYRKQCPQLVDLLQIESFDPSKHINFLFIEEAHRLLSNKSQHSGGDGETENGKQKFISQFCDLLAEIRARGTGLFLVEQSPSTLVTEVIRQCNLNITHRLTEEIDRNRLGNNMNMTPEQKQYLSVLSKGCAVVYEGGLDKPVFLNINHYEPERV